MSAAPIALHPAIGFHGSTGKESNGKGFAKYLAQLRAVIPQLTAIQIFASNPKSFAHSAWTPETNKSVKLALSELNIRLFIHAPYIINMNAWEDTITPEGERIVSLMVNLLQKGAEMGAEGVVVHVAKHVKAGEETGVKRMGSFIREVMARCDIAAIPFCRLLVETPAGQGTECLKDIKHFGKFIQDIVKEHGSHNVGACVDTCHVFACGYEIRLLADLIKTHIGWEHVYLIHLNDSESACCSCKDRHAPIGHGKIGQKSLSSFCRQAAEASPTLAFVLETPSTEYSDHISEVDWFTSLFEHTSAV